MSGTTRGVMALALLLGASLPVAALPDDDCVRRVRAARMAGDAVAVRDALRGAAEACPEDVAPLYALLAFDRDHPLPPGERDALLERLAARLEDPETAIAPYFLTLLDRPEDERLLAFVIERIWRRLDLARLEDPELLRRLAASATRLGDDARAVAALERLARLADSGDLDWRLVRLYQRLEDWPRVAERLGRLAARDPDLRPRYALALCRAGRHREAMAEAERVVAAAEGRDPRAADMLESMAWSLRDARLDAEAEKVFRQASSLDPEDSRLRAIVLHLYGSAEERARHEREQEEQWRSETAPEAIFAEGTRRLTRGDAAAARDLLERAAPHFPEREAAWYNLGLAAYKMEDWDAAATAFERAATINPDNGEALFRRGIALIRLERWPEAETALNRATQADPGQAEYAFRLGMVRNELERPEDAAEALRRAAALAPDNAQYALRLGIVLTELERWQPAVTVFERAAELDPDQDLIYYYLAMCHQQLGDSAAARRAMERYRASRGEG